MLLPLRLTAEVALAVDMAVLPAVLAATEPVVTVVLQPDADTEEA